ncbi:MAG: hypothetical protein WC374_13015 [Phycisphaerae bacterium]|jgi:hypothetical protein
MATRKNTFMFNRGFRFCVYVKPGCVEYFKNVRAAQICATNLDGDLLEVVA